MFEVGNKYGRPRQTHCKRGHEFTPENTKIRRQGKYLQRSCRTCYNMMERLKYETNPIVRKRRQDKNKRYQHAFYAQNGFWRNYLYG